MALLAKRVSACVSPAITASISVTPSARASSTICWNIPAACSSRLATLSGIRAPDSDLPKTRRAGAVPGAHNLLRLSLAAIGDTPKRPVLPPRNGGTGIPELGGNAAVAGVLQHADALAVA